MKGKICDWKDDKGFGFIILEDRSDKVFFHISDIETKERRPKIGDFVDFDLTRDNQQRLKAKHVTIKGLSSSKTRLNQSNVEPVKKTIFDYIAVVILLLSISAGSFYFYQTKDLNKIIPFLIIAIAATIFFLRKKKPKEKNFTCARCRIIGEFDKRTIQVWNKGVPRIYCSACHQQWLNAQPEIEKPLQIKSSKGGCLGVFILIATLPMLTFIGVCSWLFQA